MNVIRPATVLVPLSSIPRFIEPRTAIEIVNPIRAVPSALMKSPVA